MTLRIIVRQAITALWILIAVATTGANENVQRGVRIGWASVDITPQEPVMIAGQFHARVSERVRDPLTATVLALESFNDDQSISHTIMVSCDLINIRDALRDLVRRYVVEQAPELSPQNILLSGTHTHAGPMVSNNMQPSDSQQPYGVALEVMDPIVYTDQIAHLIADAVVRAWRARSPGGIGFGLGQAVVGHNRLISYKDGRSVMYGTTATPDFSHIEGYEDHAVHFLFTYDLEQRLTGMAINLACPSQVDEGILELSADFWHETRLELRKRFGDDLYILPQHGPAGDQSPHVMVHRRAERRMQKLSGRNRREEIAFRIGETASAVEPLAGKDINWNPFMAHRAVTVELPRRLISREAVEEALRQSEQHRETYERLAKELANAPEGPLKNSLRDQTSLAYRQARRGQNVANRFALQKEQPNVPIEIHVGRLGDVAFASNPFELYLDFGTQLHTRSPAVQTFLIQLAGGGSYAPTERAIAGGAYGAIPASNIVGAEGAALLVEKTLSHLSKVWASAVRKQMVTIRDEDALRQFALEDHDPVVRRIAMAHLSDRGLLQATALDGADEWIRSVAVGRWLELEGVESAPSVLPVAAGADINVPEATQEARLSSWRFLKDPDLSGIAQGWHQGVASEGKSIKVPEFWSRTWVESYLGYGWYQATLTLPEEKLSNDWLLTFEGIDEQAWIFVNGLWVGEHTAVREDLPVSTLWNRPFTVRVPAKHVELGQENTLIVLVHASVNTGGIHAPTHVAIDQTENP